MHSERVYLYIYNTYSSYHVVLISSCLCTSPETSFLCFNHVHHEFEQGLCDSMFTKLLILCLNPKP